MMPNNWLQLATNQAEFALPPRAWPNDDYLLRTSMLTGLFVRVSLWFLRLLIAVGYNRQFLNSHIPVVFNICLLVGKSAAKLSHHGLSKPGKVSLGAFPMSHTHPSCNYTPLVGLFLPTLWELSKTIFFFPLDSNLVLILHKLLPLWKGVGWMQSLTLKTCSVLTSPNGESKAYLNGWVEEHSSLGIWYLL